MTFKDWVDKKALAMCTNKTAVLTAMSEALLAAGTPISLHTLSTLERGSKLRNYPRAKALSEATNGQVSIAELCE